MVFKESNMKKITLLLLVIAAPLVAKSDIGVVSLDQVLNESKFGQQEQSGFEALQKQFSGTIEALDKELAEISDKAGDEDYMDSLSEDAENEMKTRFQQLMQQRGQQENQAMQILQQERYRLVQTLNTEVMRASQIVAKAKKFEMVLRDEAVFFFNSDMDVTKEVIVEMDKLFDTENNEASASWSSKS